MKPFIILACSSKIKLVSLRRLLLLCWALVSFNIAAQAMPEKCIKLPQSPAVCPNILYKRSPIDVPLVNTKEGEMICICMADFALLRIEAESEAGKIDQLVELSRKSVAVGIPEQDLLQLIRN